MATLTELNGLLNDPVLKDKLQAAVIVVGMEIPGETPQPSNHAARLAYAKTAVANPQSEATAWVRVLLGLNHTLTTQQITDANDAAILQAVRDSWDVFAGS